MTPDTHTNKEFWLSVGDGHKLYVQDWGKADALTPIIFLHGGPGGSVKDRHRTPFDGATQRVIFFDQRGCGKSTPYGSRAHNTTQDLIADIDKLAAKLKLKKFILTGNSWGSCLALAYGIAHPKKVEAMVLGGIFTGTAREINWLDKGQFRIFFPDVWDRYLEQTPLEHHANPSAHHFQTALGTDSAAAKASAYAYDSLESSLMKLDDRRSFTDFESYDPTGITLEIHYMVNGCFLPERFIVTNAPKLTMPIWLIQGRYDMVCPAATASELQQRLPNATLIWTLSGHALEHENETLTRSILRQLTGIK